MTGEITLRGRVLPVGGLKEKILAAKRAGLTTVILPRRNRKDLEEIPKHLLKDIRILFVDTMDEVMKVALGRKTKTAPKPKKSSSSSSTATPSRPGHVEKRRQERSRAPELPAML
jgi:ATP-dependent Lon protease